MFEFKKNEECQNVYEQVGDSAKPDHEFIYLSTKDIRDASRSDNIVKFRANGKSYVVRFEDAFQAKYFIDHKVM